MKKGFCKCVFFIVALVAAMSWTGCSEDEEVKEVGGVEADYVELNPYEFVLGKGNTRQLKAIILPEEAQGNTVVWSSGDELVATVDETGMVTAVAPGKTRIRAAVGREYGFCNVTVNALEMDEVQLEKKIGDQFILNVTVHADDPEKYEEQIEWSTSDENIATVYCEPYFDPCKAQITILASGTVTITAKVADMVAECTIAVEGFEPRPGIGDYLYSDGTRSSELDANKTPIGIVFWLGDPTATDMALRNEHPECTNGLAVALKGQQLMSYFSDYDAYERYATQYNVYSIGEWVDSYILMDGVTEFESILDEGYPFPIKGYNNTKALEAFNADSRNSEWLLQPVLALQNYRKQVPAPQGTSGWYIPSFQELSLLCSGDIEGDVTQLPPDVMMGECVELINEKLSKIDGAELFVNEDIQGYNLYWSSSEIYDELGGGRILLRVNMFRGNLGTDMPYSENYMRYVLAF